MKFNPLPEIVPGKRVVVVDDSIVRGNTTRQIVGMLRDAGAKEVHLRISSPPIRHPCHYGIDMSTREEMIAHGRSIEEIASELGADSLAYLSIEGVYEAVGSRAETHCDACFTGAYPLGDGGEGNGKFALEEATPSSRGAAFGAGGRSRPRFASGSVSRFRIAVLASGAGTNLQAILDRVHGRDGIEVVAVASNKPGAKALDRARGAGVETARLRTCRPPGPGSRDAAIAGVARAAVVDLVVLAGYMELLSTRVRSTLRSADRQRASGPAALLPGPRSDRTGARHGVRVTGVTVHFVDEGVDTGPIILQRAIDVPYTRDRSALEDQIHLVEHELLPEAIRIIASGAVSVDAGNPRIVHLDEQSND